VYFLHQSAKDYLSVAEGSGIFPRGLLYEHKRLARRSAAQISSTLMTDVCGLEHPGTLREEVDAGQVNRCIAAHVQYACCYWIDHLLGKPSSSSPATDLAPLDQADRETLYQFFCQDLLHCLAETGSSQALTADPPLLFDGSLPRPLDAGRPHKQVYKPPFSAVNSQMLRTLVVLVNLPSNGPCRRRTARARSASCRSWSLPRNHSPTDKEVPQSEVQRL